MGLAERWQCGVRDVGPSVRFVRRSDAEESSMCGVVVESCVSVRDSRSLGRRPDRTT